MLSNGLGWVLAARKDESRELLIKATKAKLEEMGVEPDVKLGMLLQSGLKVSAEMTAALL